MTSYRMKLATIGFAFMLMSTMRASTGFRTEGRSLVADGGWKFTIGDPAGAEAPVFSDSSWTPVTLPHDWSIEGIPEKTLIHQAGEGYYTEGIGWYRKKFTAPVEWKGKHIEVEFDGVSMNASVYLNGEKLGFHPYAYTSFRFDLSSKMRLGAPNVLAVRVDNSNQPNSRWYSGSGIYRHVRFTVTAPVRVAPWGVFVSTPQVSLTEAKVVVKTRILSDDNSSEKITIRTTLIGPSGSRFRMKDTTTDSLSKNGSEVEQDATLAKPVLWSPSNPELYRALTEVLQDGKIIDQTSTRFGVRSLSWSEETGLLLNHLPIKLAGGSVHNDNGPLGSAAFDRAEERKVELLRSAGFNAVRTAHNPPSPAFLDACDRLGLLVLEDAFDVWQSPKVRYDYSVWFNDWWQRDIDSMVYRDRNHPSIIFWGIGNEIPDGFLPAGGLLAKQLADRIRQLDRSRPLTEAFPGATSGLNPDATFAQVDVGGYNYNLPSNRAADHERVPTRIMMTTESLPSDAFAQWKVVHEYPYVIGEFVWTAMDYLGESGIGAWTEIPPKQAAGLQQIQKIALSIMTTMGANGKNPFADMIDGQKAGPFFAGWPWHAAYCGDLDLTGFRKPSSYYRDILWNGGDRVFATVRLPDPETKKIVAVGWSTLPSLPSWTWPGQEDKRLTVEVYSGAERVRLLLNDKIVAEKPTSEREEFRAVFEVPYAAGKLRAVGLRGDREVAEQVLETTGPVTHIRLSSDRPILQADGQDLAFVTVEAVDSEGKLVQTSAQRLRFSVSGPATLAGVGNGDGRSLDSYTGDTCSLFHGRALVILRASREKGSVMLTANAPEIPSASVQIKLIAAGKFAEIR